MNIREITFKISSKGRDELDNRTYKIPLKNRNVLFLINKGVENYTQLMSKCFFSDEEVFSILTYLIENDFLNIEELISNSNEKKETIKVKTKIKIPEDLIINSNVDIDIAKDQIEEFINKYFDFDSGSDLNILLAMTSNIKEFKKELKPIYMLVLKHNKSLYRDLAFTIEKINNNIRV